MAVIALCSASGSPGVTTTALGLALAWPRPVLLVEADPVGGSAILAGWFQGARDHDAGLLDVAFAAEPVDEVLGRVALEISDPVRFVPGARSHLQAQELRGLWRPLADALADLDAVGQDVIVDAGRLGMAESPQVLLERADLTLLVTRTDLPAVAATRSHADLVVRTRLWRRPGLLVVGPGRPYSAGGAAKYLGLPLAGSVPFEPRDAAVYHQGAPPRPRFHKGAFARSLHTIARDLHAQVATEPGPATGRGQVAVTSPRSVWAAAADQRQELS
ncbi:hypothetical protein APR04_001705 [Promicromonospora umidemergens]|uniref:Cellulose biosynthesis protein BcsQ n=1 Tax=Promicromonospora umidemergens TaxID=629679 RepID=A0ABP8XGZ2_9MICO|nr:hypothetical protein [Promicromonospora umidemergens]MCP2282802.1 hypothetical protein [Promicromonospora umidemergens]